jgi:lipoate-protein ligase A
MKNHHFEIESNPIHAMARDEVVLDISAKGTSWYRFYQWSCPALTIGVFSHLTATPPIPWARRITGGGLVLHGNDLTFAVVTDDQPNKIAYGKVGQAIVKALKTMGICAGRKENTKPPIGTYACFSESVGGDVMVEGRKFAGYAMRRRRGRILMQGSLALTTPPYELMQIVAKPENYLRSSISLSDLTHKEDAVVNLAIHISNELCQSLPNMQNFNKLEGLEDKIIAQYSVKYSDPDLKPARR